MNDDAHPTVPPRVSIGLGGVLFMMSVCVAVVLLTAGGLVWMTSALETWLDLPPMSMLIAVLGVAIIVTVLLAQGRIVNAIHDTRRDPFDMLREHLQREWDAEQGDDDDHEPVESRTHRQ